MPESEGGTNFFDTLSVVLPVAIRAIDGDQQVRRTGAGAITGGTLLLVGGGLVVVILVIVLTRK